MSQIHLVARLAQGLVAVTIAFAVGLKSAWAALTAGSRAIPFGDNSTLIRDLAARIAASNRGA
jgi:hypothetical protein